MKMALVADDEYPLRLLVRAMMCQAGYNTVLEAADGDEAWELIRQHHPPLVLLDVQMPGRTGLELTRAIRRDPALADTRVVLVSAKTQDSDIEAGLEAGASGYLTKPFLWQQLLAAIEANAPSATV